MAERLLIMLALACRRDPFPASRRDTRMHQPTQACLRSCAVFGCAQSALMPLAPGVTLVMCHAVRRGRPRKVGPAPEESSTAIERFAGGYPAFMAAVMYWVHVLNTFDAQAVYRRGTSVTGRRQRVSFRGPIGTSRASKDTARIGREVPDLRNLSQASIRVGLRIFTLEVSVLPAAWKTPSCICILIV